MRYLISESMRQTYDYSKTGKLVNIITKITQSFVYDSIEERYEHARCMRRLGFENVEYGLDFGGTFVNQKFEYTAKFEKQNTKSVC